MLTMTALTLQMAQAATTDSLAVHIEDMHCRKCADRINARLSKVEGVDTVTFRIGKHLVNVRFDAELTNSAEIRAQLLKSGYTPCTYYQNGNAGYGYFLLPAEQATESTQKAVMAIDGVADVTVNTRRKAMAVTFFQDKITAEQLLAAIQQAGINATLPKPHECSEEKEQQKR